MRRRGVKTQENLPSPVVRPQEAVMIKTQAEYEAAMERIQELSGAPEDTQEEKQLIQIILDVEIWTSKHRL